MKACPYCAESIQDAALVCPRCQREQPGYPRTPPYFAWLFVILLVGGSLLAVISILLG